MARILVTGGAGYLGSVLVPRLLRAGHEVTVLDRFFFGEESLSGSEAARAIRLRQDTRWVDAAAFRGIEAVVDLAALSNDPAGELDPAKTFEINYLGRSRVARLAREAGVARYVVSSSCSVYGFQPGQLDERAEPRPLTVYARANVLVEADNLPLAGPTFATTALRFATLYGPSPRMRYDLAVNGMALGGTRTGRIPVARDGQQWRPFLHVEDAARAIETVLAADPAGVSGRLFNVGSDEQNFQVRPLAELVAQSLEGRPALEWYGDPDTRSYRVDFRQARETLGFAPALRPADAVRSIEAGLRDGSLPASPKTQTVDWYRHLLTDPAAAQSVELRGSVF